MCGGCCKWTAATGPTSGEQLSNGNIVVLLELAVQGGLTDAEDSRGGDFVAIGFAESANDGATFELFERNNFVLLRELIDRRVVQVRRQRMVGWKLQRKGAASRNGNR